MAQITVVYKDFAEMLAVARELLKGEEHAEAVQVSTEQEKPAASVAYGQQIAPHFPNANVGTAPANQTAPAQNVPTPEPVQNTQTAHAQSGAVPVSQHTYSMDELARAAMTLMDKGGMAELQQLLAGYGCETLQQLPPEQYGNFATSLRGMGAQI